MDRFASILLVDPRGWVLLQERDELPVIDPEKWGMVGGHVDEGEDVEVAAYRELAEETGLLLPAGALTRWRDFEVFHTAYAAVAQVVVFAAAADVSDTDIIVGEGRQIVFVEPGAAGALELTESATIVLPAFLDSGLYASMAP